MEIRLTDQEKTQKILSPDAVYGIMQRILLRENEIDQEKEHFWMVGMNTAGYILYIELVSLGGRKSVTIEPMNVYRFAVIKNADRVIAVHNHPSGNLKPSGADKQLTDRLIQVGRILDITLADHLIISTKTYRSFQAIGLMKELRASLEYVPPYQIAEQIRERAEEMAKEAIQIAEHAAKIERVVSKEAKEAAKAAEEKARTEAEKAKEAKALAKAERDQKNALIKFLLKKNTATEEIAKILKVTPEEVEKAIKKKK